MSDNTNQVPPIPVPPAAVPVDAVPPVEPAPAAVVMPPLVDLTGSGTAVPGVPPAAPVYSQPNPYVPTTQPDPYAAPASYAQPDPYAQPTYTQPNPYAAAPTYAAPNYQANPYGAQAPYGHAAPSSALSITSMILGIVGFFGSLVGFGFLLSLAAVITGHIGLKRQPHAKGYALAGVISGYVGIAIALIYIAFFVVLFIIGMNSGTSY